LAPLLIGFLLSTVLYGVFLLQTFTYCLTFKTDSKLNRCMVIYLVVMETLTAGTTFVSVYEPLIMNYGQANAMSKAPTSLAIDAILTALIATVVQFFFAWRIKVITKSNLFAGIIAFFALGSLAAGITVGVSMAMIGYFHKFKVFGGAVIAWLGTAAVTDLLTSLGIIRFLRAQKSGFQYSDSVVNRIMMLSVQTGALITLVAIIDTIMFIIVPPEAPTLMFIWNFSISKLYGNFVLSTLNSRTGMNEIIDSKQRNAHISFVDMENLKSATERK